MMRTFFSILFFFNCLLSAAQGERDTILVSKGYKTVLIFEEPILESIIGNSDEFLQASSDVANDVSRSILKLTYNRVAKERENMTNLTVITESGEVHDFFLKYSGHHGKLTWKIKRVSQGKEQTREMLQVAEPTDMDIRDTLNVVGPMGHHYGNTDGVETKGFPNTPSVEGHKGSNYDSLYTNDRDGYYRLKSSFLQTKGTDIKRCYAIEGKIGLHLLGVYFDREQLYLHLKISNDNTIDLDIDFLHYSLGTEYRKGSTVQDTRLFPEYSFYEPTEVPGLQERSFVVVFNKFTLDGKIRFHVEMKERNGARSLDLAIEPRYINDPIREPWWDN